MFENAGEFGGTRRAVAFADEIFRGVPSLVTGDVLVDEVGEDGGVLNDSVELRGILAGSGAAVAGGNGVDEDEIGGVEERIFVVFDGVRSGHAVAVGSEDDCFRAHAHVSEKRGGARAAVVDERNRAGRDVRDAVFCVSDEEERGFGMAFVIFDDVGSGGSGVIDLFAADARAVMSDGGFFDGRRWRRFVLVLHVLLLRRRWLLRGTGRHAAALLSGDSE